MKSLFLSRDVVAQVVDACGISEANSLEVAVRLEHALGEKYVDAYLLLFNDKTLVVASKGSGKSCFACSFAPLGEWGVLSIEERSFQTMCKLVCQNRVFEVEWNKMEDSDAQIIIQQLKKSTSTESSLTLFFAGLMFVVGADAQLHDKEDLFLHQRGSSEDIRKGVAFYQNSSFEDFIVAASAFSISQKRSFIANALELAMCDGSFGSKEQVILGEMVKLLGISELDYKKIEETILEKNSYGILFQ